MASVIDSEAMQRKQDVGLRLQGIIDQRVSTRASIEQGWMDDTRQYNGEYDPKVAGEIKGSKAFYNGTRKLCNFAEARLCEMAIPTNDRNWDLSPTPLPDLPEQLAGMEDQIIAVAKQRAMKMRQLMDDQTTECGYNDVLRRVVHDAVVLGTGVIKSPVVRRKTTSRFSRVEQQFGMVEYRAEVVGRIVPTVECVSPWDFYPDPDAVDLAGSENTFERHRMTAKQVRDLAKTPGFDPDAVREVLKHEAGFRSESSTVEQLNPQSTTGADKRYHLWEFHGSLPYEDACAILGNGEELDPLESTMMHVWFCDNQVLKASRSLVDEGEQLYEVFCWERNDHSIFGFGLPRRIEHSQRIANSVLRMMMDNGAFSVLPQYVVDGMTVEPADGVWDIEPGKLWRRKGGGQSQNKPIEAVDTPVRLDVLMQLFERAVKLMEEESGVHMLQQSGQEPAVTQTATGTSLLLNSASSPLRRLVREFDRVNAFAIRALYRFNMQFSEDDDCKGDYDVRVLGSSSLMVREQQVSGLMAFINMAQASPALAPITKIPEAWRRVVQAMQISADDLVMTDDELAQAQRNQPQAPDVNMLKLQLDQRELQLREQEAAMKQQLAVIDAQNEQRKLAVQERDSQNDLMRTQIQAQRESERLMSNERMFIARVAAETQKSSEAIRSQLGLKRMELDNKNRLFNAEAALRLQTGAGI